MTRRWLQDRLAGRPAWRPGLPGAALCAGAILLAAVAALAEPKPERAASKSVSKHPVTITQNLDCADCHTPTGWRILSGSGGAGGFDHARTGFPLTGRHAHAACTECHRAGRRMSRECAGCHEDAHQRRLGLACDRCHSARSWTGVAAIARHRLSRLPLTGMHALAACTECHQRTTQHQWRGVPADCLACHANEYRRQDIHPLHTGVPGDPSSPPLPRDCGLCHRATSWVPAFAPASFQFRTTAAALKKPDGHDLKFPISFGKHRSAECSDCHPAATAPRAVRCTGCHAHNPLRLQAQHAKVAGGARGQCLGCHVGGAAR